MFTAVDIISSSFISQIYSPFALVPVTGHLAANADTTAKQTAVFTVPVLSDIKKTQLWTAILHVPENLTLFKYNYLLCDSSGIMKTGALQTNFLLNDSSLSDLFHQHLRKKEIESMKYWEDILKGVNPNSVTKKEQWLINCQRCALVLLRRLKGENYTAKSCPRGDKYMNLNTLFTVMKNPPDKYVIRVENKESLIEIIESKMKLWGEKSAAVIGLEIKGWTYNHLFNVVQKDGQIIFVDSQRYPQNANEYLDSAVYPPKYYFFPRR